MNARMAPAAGTWRLGHLTVNLLGFGAVRLAGSTAFAACAQRGRAQAVAVLRRAVELGVNHIDTAASYFSATRSASELTSHGLSHHADALVIWSGAANSASRSFPSSRSSARVGWPVLRSRPARRWRPSPAHTGCPPRRCACVDAPAKTRMLAIPGTGDLRRLKENLAARALRLLQEELAFSRRTSRG